MENRYLDIVGKYTSAKVFTDNIEPEAVKMIYDLCNHPVFENAKIRVMSDVHAGRGIVIGFSCPIGEAVAPAHVGCDIGCQMTTIELSKPLTEEEIGYRLSAQFSSQIFFLKSGVNVINVAPHVRAKGEGLEDI